MSPMIHTLRLEVYEALEERSYRTIQDLAQSLDSGTPATQAQVRAVLYAEPETFYQMEDWWDLAIFNRFENQAFHGRGRGGFDERKFLGRVLAEALRTKGTPIQLKTLAEKYLLKIRNRIGLQKNQFPTGSGEIVQRLRRYLEGNPGFYLLHDDCGECVWTAPQWLESAEPAPVVAPAYRLPDTFLDQAALYLEKCGAQPVRLLIILQALLGIDANHADFSAAFAQANAALSADDETFAQVQEQAWTLANYLPADIEDIPARVAIPRWRNPQEEQLIAELYELPLDALGETASFAGDDAKESESAQFDESYFGPLRLVLPYHWRQNGVLKVNASERRLFPDRPARAHLQFTDETNATFPVWLNNDTGYLHGLREWYAAYLVPAGGIFYIERAPGSHYNFKIRIKEATSRTFDGRQYFCEVDPDTYIEEVRLRDLEALRAKVEVAAATIKDVMCDLFESCPAETALHYRQVWAQVHVIRPTTRRTVAAILSAFPCFFQADPGSGFWCYDPGLRYAPPKYQARRVVKPVPAVKPTPVEARPARYWLAPVSAASWDKLARPAGAGEGVFLAPWHGRSRVGRADGVAFFDTGTERVIAAVEALRQPILDATAGRREMTVKPALDAFNPIPYADLAGALSVPKPDPEGFPVEITPEDWKLLLERLRPLMAPKPAEPSLKELIETALPGTEGPEVGEIIPHTFGPNPTIGAFIAKYGRPYDPKEPYLHSAFAADVKAGKNTAIYEMHQYHTKVPPQGIEPYIEHYTRPGDIVLDLFCGSGMTGVAALKLGRRVILNDLSPAATHIAYNYCTPVDVAALKREFERIKNVVQTEFDWLYQTTCDRCGGPASIQHTIWSDVFRCANDECGAEIVLWEIARDRDTGEVREEFRCPQCERSWKKAQLERLRAQPVETNYECPRCKPKRGRHPITQAERDLIANIEATPIPYWFPTQAFDKEREQYRRDALHLRSIETAADFFTHRNLWALARIYHEISACHEETLIPHLRFWFTSFTWLASRMYRYRVSGGGGQQGRLTIPSLSKEQNVMRLAQDKWASLEQLYLNSQSQVSECIITTGSATDLSTVPTDTIDYVFTDPPFGSNLYYDDLNFIWESWLGHLTDSTYEAVVHRAQRRDRKTLSDYEHLMTESFREMYRVLKPGRWASVVFHNSDDRVWQAIQRGAEAAGFDLVNAMVFDKEQRSFKGIRGEKGLEKVTNFDIVLNLHKHAEVQPAAQPEAQERTEALIIAAVRKHLLDGPAPDYRTGQYLHSLAIRTLLNERISIELTWSRLEGILEQHFRHVNCHWYLPREAVTATGHGFLVRSETAAVAWLEHVLATDPQTEADLIPQWQIATLGAGSKIKATLGELLKDHFWQDEATSAWTVPTAVQREILKKRRIRPQQLSLGLEFSSDSQPSLFEAQPDSEVRATPTSEAKAQDQSRHSLPPLKDNPVEMLKGLTFDVQDQLEWSNESQTAYVVVRGNQQHVLQPQFYNRANLTRWTINSQSIQLVPQYRYLFVQSHSNKVGWVRVGRKTISLPERVYTPDAPFFESPRWEVSLEAEWDDVMANEANLCVEFNRPSEPAALSFGLLFLPGRIQIVSVMRSDAGDRERTAATEALLERIHGDSTAFFDRLRQLVLDDFEYVDRLIGIRDETFFGESYHDYSLRLTRHGNSLAIVAESRSVPSDGASFDPSDTVT